MPNQAVNYVANTLTDPDEAIKVLEDLKSSGVTEYSIIILTPPPKG